MAEKKRPEQRSRNSGKSAPDQSRPKPTGAETFTTPPKSTARPERESDEAWDKATAARQGAASTQEREVYLNESITRMQEVATEYFRRMGDTAGELTQQARKVYDTSRGYVGSNPGSTIGGAFIVGVLLGFLLDRD